MGDTWSLNQDQICLQTNEIDGYSIHYTEEYTECDDKSYKGYKGLRDEWKCGL